MSDTGSTLDAPQLLGRYRPRQLLAKGGSSTVFIARDDWLGRDVAIKLLSAEAAADSDAYRSELRVLAGLSHHGIVSILDTGIDDSTPDDPRPFIVMELVPGRTLASTVAHRALNARQISEIAYDLAETLEYVHSRGVIHRDISPANIMLVDYGTSSARERARITDFGIALDGSTVVVENGTTTGTAAYLSPEQARNDPLTSKTDIYSLGLVLLECFTRVIAFPGQPVESAVARLSSAPDIPSSLPPHWIRLLTRMTAQAPSERPTAGEVATSARQIIIQAERLD